MNGNVFPSPFSRPPGLLLRLFFLGGPVCRRSAPGTLTAARVQGKDDWTFKKIEEWERGGFFEPQIRWMNKTVTYHEIFPYQMHALQFGIPPSLIIVKTYCHDRFESTSHLTSTH